MRNARDADAAAFEVTQVTDRPGRDLAHHNYAERAEQRREKSRRKSTKLLG